MLLVADLDPKLATHDFLHGDPEVTAKALAEI
jgi:hypothetical protein